MYRLTSPRCHLAAILVAYAALAAVVQTHCADLLSSDGECYLRMASYYVKGDFRHAIFGQWSPLGSWMAVPFVAAGVAPRLAFRLLIATWGALCVVATWRLGDFGLRIADCGLKSAIGNRKSGIAHANWPRLAAAACAALMALGFSAEHRVDLLVAALVLFYLDAAMDERLLTSRGRALAAGALGGLAYLAKFYALPFVAVHYTLTVAARGWAERLAPGLCCAPTGSQDQPSPYPLPARERGPTAPPFQGGGRGRVGARSDPGRDEQGPNSWADRGGRVLRAWALGAAGFAVVAAPWVVVLSARFGRLTLGTTGSDALAYTRLGEDSFAARRSLIVGLRRPPADAWNVWQDSALSVPAPPKAPPAGSAFEALALRARWALGNAGEIAAHVAGADALRLGLVAVGLLPVALVLSWRRREMAFRYAAVLAAVGVYCGGYAFTYAGDKRFFWPVLLLAAVLAFHFVGVVAKALRRVAPRVQQRAVAGGLGLIVLASFAVTSVGYLRLLLAEPPPGREHRLAAEWLRERGVAGPLASTDWWDGLHTAYYLRAKYAGMPGTRQPQAVEAEMRAAGARALLVWRDPHLATALRAEPAFQLVGFMSDEALGSARGGLWGFRLE